MAVWVLKDELGVNLGEEGGTRAAAGKEIVVFLLSDILSRVLQWALATISLLCMSLALSLMPGV